jgi:hypothetical protein
LSDTIRYVLTIAKLREALKWALLEGQKGYYTVSQGAGTFYHCRFCHAVSERVDKLNHEDDCKWFHAKKEVLDASV